jgi:hypothetical protein
MSSRGGTHNVRVDAVVEAQVVEDAVEDEARIILDRPMKQI